jgi:hypothetical protein
MEVERLGLVELITYTRGSDTDNSFTMHPFQLVRVKVESESMADVDGTLQRITRVKASTRCYFIITATPVAMRTCHARSDHIGLFRPRSTTVHICREENHNLSPYTII